VYALFILIGIAVGVWFASTRASVYSVSRQHIVFASMYGILGAIAGGKVLYLITILPFLVKNASWFFKDMNNISAIFAGGFVYFGGLFGAVFGVWVYAKQYKLKAGTMIDIIAPALPLIHGFGRVGCFFAGCCYGRPINPPFGVYFQNSPVAPHDIALFPVQLLEAVLNMILFVIMYIKFRKKETHQEAITFYLIGYSILRFLLEFFRYDAQRGIFFNLSTSQWISLLVCVVLLCIHWRKIHIVKH